MHDIWNPWHGCVRYSEGCANCYMYFLDELRDQDGSKIYKTKNDFDKPLQKDRNGRFKIQSGEQIRVCMTSDFFLKEADIWREEVWNIISQRPDVLFILITKRPERIRECLPADWGEGWENVFLYVTTENQKRADERVPLLLELPFKHKGVMVAPFLGPVSLEPWLASGQIERVQCGGENYGGSRPCDFDWVKALRDECAEYDIGFCFMETGTRFIKDGKTYTLKGKRLQSQMAYKSGVSFAGKPLKFKYCDSLGMEIPKEHLYQPTYRESCQMCASRLFCNGCSNCGACERKKSQGSESS